VLFAKACDANGRSSTVFYFDWYTMENPVAITEDTLLIRQTMAYVVELYREMTEENGAPTLGTQNQVVEFILADPELCLAVSPWARTAEIEEATTHPSARLPDDGAHQRIRSYLQSVMEPSLFSRVNKAPADRR
jgi:hypothetical protein